MEFKYGDTSKVHRDLIVLESHDTYEKLAHSYAFAQSWKLSIYEEDVDNTIENTNPILENLRNKGSIHLSNTEIQK